MRNKRIIVYIVICGLAIPVINVMAFLIGAGLRSYPVLYGISLTSVLPMAGVICGILYFRKPTKTKFFVIGLGTVYSFMVLVHIFIWLFGVFL